MKSSGDKAVAEWFEEPLGARVLREERVLARAAFEDVFGFEFLQMGAWGGEGHLLSAARTQHTTLVAPEAGAIGATLCAPLTTLPFAADSIDAIVLPHTLELVEDPYAVLREAERVLCAEGCMLICRFNPWSGCGARRLLGRGLRRPNFPPQTRRLLSERRLRDWMALLDFEVDQVYGYLGLLPLAGRAPREPESQPEYRPRRAWAAGAYLLKARKRVHTMTLLRPRRRVRPRVLVTAEVTHRVSTGKNSP